MKSQSDVVIHRRTSVKIQLVRETSQGDTNTAPTCTRQKSTTNRAMFTVNINYSENSKQLLCVQSKASTNLWSKVISRRSGKHTQWKARRSADHCSVGWGRCRPPVPPEVLQPLFGYMSQATSSRCRDQRRNPLFDDSRTRLQPPMAHQAAEGSHLSPAATWW